MLKGATELQERAAKDSSHLSHRPYQSGFGPVRSTQNLDLMPCMFFNQWSTGWDQQLRIHKDGSEEIRTERFDMASGSEKTFVVDGHVEASEVDVRGRNDFTPGAGWLKKYRAL
ncbi:hypothetical protein BSKO_00208 [Bryopsis sp. KO-2023]|nr:hypothetical protein BSKO_00208 [Bryopsis sp. KO-2023]